MPASQAQPRGFEAEVAGLHRRHRTIWVAEAKQRTGDFAGWPPSWSDAQSDAVRCCRERVRTPYSWLKVEPLLVGEVGRVEGRPARESKRGFEKLLLDSGLVELKPRNVSRLIRIVKSWTASSERAAGPIVRRDAFSAAHGNFLTAVSRAEHPLLERHAEKSHWAWFSWWRSVTLAGLEQGVSGRAMLDLLRLMAEALRRCSPVSVPASRLSISDRLERLAGTIVGHAPPLLLAGDDLSAEVG